MTASAKLKSSARTFVTPASMPVDIVAPERENPLKGRQSPCTVPTSAALFTLNSEIFFVPDAEDRLSDMSATRMSTPAIAWCRYGA